MTLIFEQTLSFKTSVKLLLNFLLELQDGGNLVDTTLVGSDGVVMCHGMIVLPRIQPYLQMGQGNFTIILPDFTINDLEEMLCYCYTGR